MSINNMWGNFSEVKNIDAPTIYLNEQARALTHATGGILDGEVYKIAEADEIEIMFNIKASYLDYTYTLFEVRHKLFEFYPLEIKDNANNVSYKCNNKQDFLSALEQILQSERVHKIVTMLLIQSKN